MQVPDSMLCEACGFPSPVVMIWGHEGNGRQTHWPKYNERSGALYLFIQCPKCGEREQQVRQPDKSN